MRIEPKQRRDGLCVARSCRTPLPKLAVVHGDPFHSMECCRTYHGVPFLADAKAEKYAAQKRKPHRLTAKQREMNSMGLKGRAQ